MLQKVKRAIEKYNMLSEGEAVLCCLSGGADSVTLLLCLRELGYDTAAIHINHHLRGQEADRDQQFCADLCSRLGVPLKVEHVDVAGYCRTTGTSTEEGARELRYEVFRRSPIEKIATAHTLSDSFETCLFNLARGAGAKGICGIPPVRDRFIRPLIGCTRREIEDYLTGCGQEWITDSSNLSDDYSRNRIRHNVVPALKELYPEAEHSFERLSQSLRADDDYLYSQAALMLAQAEGSDGYSLDTMSQTAGPVLSRAVILLLKENGISFDSSRVNELCRLVHHGGKVCLTGNVYALASNGLFRIAALEAPGNESVTVKKAGNYELCGKLFTVEIIKKEQIDFKINRTFTYTALDYAKIKGVISVRTRQAGDKIRISGRGCTKSVKKLFSESVPLEKRGQVLLLCDGNGVCAVEGFGADERCAVSDATDTVLLFGVKSE